MSVPADDPLVGTVVDGRYRVLARISEGGMGIVYRAEHVFLKREVALKRLHPELTGHGQAVARFEREAQAAAKIDHPNVCQVLDCGVGRDGAFFIAMELLDGTPLDRRIAEAAPLPLDEIIDIGAQICDALGRAHALQIVHRDLKPENIMLVPRRGAPGRVAKIMDFGIAKVAQEGDGRKLTQAGMIFGTPAYMAPEQASGGAVDARADLYALGVILFEMAVGRCPFESPTVSGLLTRHLTEPAPPLEAAAPQLEYPPPFRALVARCLAKDPAERWTGADELAVALRACAGLPVRTLAPLPAPSPRPDAPTLPAEPSTASFGVPTIAGATAPTTFPVTLPGAGSRLPWVVGAVAVGLALVTLVVVLIAQSGNGGSSDARAGRADVLAARVSPDVASAAPSERPASSPREPAPAAPAVAASEVPDAALPFRLPDLLAPPASPPPTAAERAAALAAERQAFEAATPELAAALAAGGSAREGLARLQRLAAGLDGSAHFQFELSLALQRNRNLPQALDHAARAVELDGRYAAEPSLLALAAAALASRPAADAAERFLEGALDEESAPELARTILEGARASATLRRALDLLRRRTLLAEVPEYLALPLRALAEDDCAGRRAALQEIQARPDARMAPYLRRMRSDRGCGILGLQDCWACERADIGPALSAVAAATAPGGEAADAGA